MRVHAGDIVRAGQAITDGPLVPHDILRISGEEAVQEYLVREVQNVYRSQGVRINDKHIEIIISQMLRKVRVETDGDTTLLEGLVIDRFIFRKKNRELNDCVKITAQNDSQYEIGAIVPKDVLEHVTTEIMARGGTPPEFGAPMLASAATQLLGITKAAVQSSSFLSAASFQETTKVLTEAALSSKTDHLIGLKENIILGHLVPAGTGFRKYQLSQWRYHPEAAETLSKMPVQSSRQSFRLLEDDRSDFPAPHAVVDDPFYNEAVTDFPDQDFGDMVDGFDDME